MYHIVAVDSRARRDGQPVEVLGLYNPVPASTETRIDEDKVFAWLRNGAQLSDTVRSLFKKQGILQKWAAMRSGQPVPEAAAQATEPEPVPEAPARPGPGTPSEEDTAQAPQAEGSA
jgi:small subunit ribosomal protein S16